MDAYDGQYVSFLLHADRRSLEEVQGAHCMDTRLREILSELLQLQEDWRTDSKVRLPYKGKRRTKPAQITPYMTSRERQRDGYPLTASCPTQQMVDSLYPPTVLPGVHVLSRSFSLHGASIEALFIERERLTDGEKDAALEKRSKSKRSEGE